MTKNVKKWGLIAILCLVALSVAGCTCCLWSGGRQTNTSRTPVAVAAATPTLLAPRAVGQSDVEEPLLINIYKRVNPAVVNIRVIQLVDDSSLGLPDMPETEDDSDQYQQGVGSGFVMDDDGHIITNNHVIEDAEDIQVTFADGTIVRATVVGADADSDLAVIQVDPSQCPLVPVELGDSDQVEVGQRALALGNPFGLRGTLTVGIVSALGRSSAAIGGRFSIPELIQTDAAINPGNSGGPVLDSQGRVIGVTIAYESNASGVGFAIPVNTVKRVVPELIQTGHYLYPWLGISGTDLSLDLIEAMDLPVRRGAIVAEVTPDSPAAEAGLRGNDQTVNLSGREIQVGGDVITAIDAQSVERFDDILVYILRYAKVGQTVTLTIIRDGREQSVRVKLAERPGE
jgi:S1-C subfamily serine protease